MDDLSNNVASNTRDLNSGRRRAFNVRINGEEHSSNSRNGVANIYFPIDGNLITISECCFKLIFNDGIVTGGSWSDSEVGTNMYPTLASWEQRWPLGSEIDVDGFFGCQCVTEGHFVSMADGTYKDVSDIKVGDRVFNHDGTHINTIIAIRKELEPVVEYRTSTSFQLTTPDHHVYRADGTACRIGELRTTDKMPKQQHEMLLFPQCHYEMEHGLTDDELKWLGFYLGDGSKVWRWSNSKVPTARVTIGVQHKYDYLDSLDIDCIKKNHSNGTAKEYLLVNSSHPKLCEIIGRLDGKGLPKEFNAREYALIIEGYLQADGYLKREGAYLCSSICKPLLLSLQYGCMLNGWNAIISKCHNPRGGKRVILGNECKTRPYWRMTINYNKPFSCHFQGKTAHPVKEDYVYLITTDNDHSYIVDNQGVENCVDYANAFWLAQTGRAVQVGTSLNAYTMWTEKKAENMGTEFDAVENWSDLKPGDWAIWQSPTTGHVAMVYKIDNEGVHFWSQNYRNVSDMGSPLSEDIIPETSQFLKFLGAFRYKQYETS